jgi:hypothetical protein
MFGALVSLLGSYLEARALGKMGAELGEYFDRWLKLIASIVIRSYVTMLAVWSAAGLGSLAKTGNPWFALVFGFLAGLGGTASVIFVLWTTSPLTKGITLITLSQVAKTAVEQNVTSTTRS